MPLRNAPKSPIHKWFLRKAGDVYDNDLSKRKKAKDFILHTFGPFDREEIVDERAHFAQQGAKLRELFPEFWNSPGVKERWPSS